MAGGFKRERCLLLGEGQVPGEGGHCCSRGTDQGTVPDVGPDLVEYLQCHGQFSAKLWRVGENQLHAEDRAGMWRDPHPLHGLTDQLTTGKEIQVVKGVSGRAGHHQARIPGCRLPGPGHGLLVVDTCEEGGHPA
jgi:hypothetical protein